jgi:aminoglycoside phosphotransferase (APT) family kinase protein
VSVAQVKPSGGVSGDGVADSVEPAFRERAAAAMAALRSSAAVDPSARATGLTQLEGGWSRHSYALDASDAEGDHAYVVRVKPPGALLDTDLRQEYQTYRLLGEHGIGAPAVHAFEERAETPFEGPFFVMDRAPGTSPNVWRRRDRAALEENWAEGGSLAEDLVDALAQIHAIPAASVEAVLPSRNLRQAVEHWSAIQADMAMVRDPVVEDAFGWLLGRDHPPVEPALVHGDYRVGNCLVAEGRVTAILDWELAYFGDPRFDLGYFSLDYLAGKFTRPGSKLLGAVADRDWFMREYSRRSGSDVDPEVVRTYSVLGALILIAILNTGVRMYSDGRTEDVRMVWSRFAIPGLRQDLTRLMGY